MKKILLLGAGGFVGSHLAVELLKRERFSITALDITHDKLDEGLRRAAQFELNDSQLVDSAQEIDDIVSKIKYVDLDIMDPARQDDLKSLISENDIVVNLIAICNPAVYVSDPIFTFDIGFRGNLNVFDICVKFDRRLIQFSTSEVYGKSPSIYVEDGEFLFNEDSSNLIMGPINRHRWIYACGKQLLERIIHAHGIKKNFHYSIIRPFNYIGEMIDYLPSQKEGSPRVFSHFMDALLNSSPLKLVNGGNQKRCYTYIKDATEAHVRIIEEEETCDKEIFNVGTNDNETSIRDLAFRMRDIYDKHFRTEGQALSSIVDISGSEFYGEGYDDVDRRLLDNSKLIKLTGWKPEYDLDQMLLRIMSYYVSQVRMDV
ncbi:MAG: NAD-dependent epimerase/dehydratase family protein [Verrucomicrobia bacterium]|nr:NAD-dependent epimerase/dehydratase family protein [Verrucomicrobiota bacterium]MDA1069751.1 NAD-dependent epimerase/dehydratase family protein [Verrucomicrobiota bacterium]